MTLASHIIKQLAEHQASWEPVEQCWYGDGTINLMGRVGELGEHGFWWKVLDVAYASKVEIILLQGEAKTKDEAKRAAWTYIIEVVKARYA